MRSRCLRPSRARNFGCSTRGTRVTPRIRGARAHAAVLHQSSFILSTRNPSVSFRPCAANVRTSRSKRRPLLPSIVNTLIADNTFAASCYGVPTEPPDCVVGGRTARPCVVEMSRSRRPARSLTQSDYPFRTISRTVSSSGCGRIPKSAKPDSSGDATVSICISST